MLTLKEVPVWDRTIRWFHWINVLTVLTLIVLGTIILNANSLGVSSEGKVSLKILHAWTGYVFALNLGWRLVWGFIGSRYSRWPQVLPFQRGYLQSLKEWIQGTCAGHAPEYKGHNPAARLMLLALYVLLFTQVATGLILAGTDLYFPPFGHEFAEWATAAGEDHSLIQGLVPGAKEMLDPEGYAAMRRFREPFVEVHEMAFWGLLVLIVLHIAAVVFEEIKSGNRLVSAMFNGKKIFKGEPKE